MKYLRLSLIATVCALTLTACSSNNSPDRYPEEAKKETKAPISEKVKEVEKQLSEKEAELANKEQELTALKQKVAEQTQEKEQLVKKEQQLTGDLEKQKADLESQKKALEEQKNNLNNTISQLEKEKAELLAEVEQARPLVEQMNNDKAESIRIAKNKVELAKGFTDNGVDTSNISYVSGALLEIKEGEFTAKAVADKSKNLNTLIVDGKEIELFSEADMLSRQETYENETHNFNDISVNGLTGKVGSLPKRKIGDDFAQMRFGYVTDKEGKTTLFVQGHQTPIAQTEELIKSPFSYYRAGQEGETEILRALPTEGRWEYQGYAFYGKDNQYNQFAVNAIADMDNKKVKVDMMDGDATKLTFGGAIDGNSFAGNYQGVEAKGAFYGTKGQDIGGEFYQTQGVEKDYNGVFGATQRDCGWMGCEMPAQDLKTFTLSQ